MRQGGLRAGLCALALVLGLAGCGGDEVPPDATTDSATVDADGGKIVADLAEVVVPPGAMTTPATIRVAADAAGAPPLPAWVRATGPVVALTPHGSAFSEPVTVRLPVPAAPLAANERLYIAKVQPGGEWEVLSDTVQTGNRLEVQVRSFSYFVPVAVPFTLTPTVLLPNPEPFSISPLTLACNGVPCANPERVRTMTVTVSASGNGGQVPQNCVDPTIELSYSGLSDTNLQEFGSLLPVTSAIAIRRDLAFPSTFGGLFGTPPAGLRLWARLRCTDPSTNAKSWVVLRTAELVVDAFPRAAGVPAVRDFPPAITATVGEQPALRAVFTGGASFQQGSGNLATFPAPTDRDHAVVYFERLAPGETGWTTVGTGSQLNADASPFPGSPPWAYWSLSQTLGPVALADQGTRYRVRACYPAPNPNTPQTNCALGPVATLNVLPTGTAPAFTQQPASLLIRPGQTASFSAQVGGSPAPTLQWQTRAPGATGAWTDVTGGTGAATANYTTPALQLADNGVQFRLVATNGAGTTASEAVQVSVSAEAVPPAIGSQPVSLTVVAGSEAVFAVGATGTAALSYQWSRDRTPITGANAPQLKIANVSKADEGAYTVRVTNAAGGVTSAAAVLTVNPMPTAAPVAPGIVTQPAAVAVTEGNVATFGVGVTGSGPLSFQWRRNGVDIPGATAAALTLPAVKAADAGSYSVLVRNAAGSVASESATLAVAPAGGAATVAPVIVVPPGSVVVAPGMSAAFGVTVQGSGPLTYRWLRNGVEVPGQTAAVYTIGAASSDDVGTYRVEVSNAAGSALTGFSQVVLLGAPAITQQPAAASVAAGATASFGVGASGDALRYQWTRNQVAIAGANGATYTTPALTPGDTGAVYAVIVYNGAGVQISNGATLTVTSGATAGLSILAGDFSAGGGGGSADGNGTSARFDFPESLVADAQGNLFVATSNAGRVRKIDAMANVTTIAQQAGTANLALNDGGDLYAASVSYCGLMRIRTPLAAGAATEPITVGTCPGLETRGATMGGDGLVYLALRDAHAIVRVIPDLPFSRVEVFAGAADPVNGSGSANGAAGVARFSNPMGLALGPDGNIYVADSGNHTIRRITPAGVVSTFAGSPGRFGTTDGYGAEARLYRPTDLAFDAAGNLLVLQRGDPANPQALVRRIRPDGEMTTLFDATAEALALAAPGQEAFATNIRGIAVRSDGRIAFAAGQAILLRTLP